MGLQIIIKGTDFSALGLGKVITANKFMELAAITETIQKDALNALVLDMVNYGLWDKMTAIYPFVGDTSTAHKFNLKDPRDLDEAYRLTFAGEVSDTYSAAGFKTNGTTTTANTWIAPKVIDNVHLSYYNTVPETSGTNGLAMGLVSNVSHAIYLGRNFNSRTVGAISTGALTTDTAYDRTKTGLLLANRTATTNISLYDAGVSIGTSIAAVTSPSTMANNVNTLRIGSATSSNNTVNYFGTVTLGFASYGVALTMKNIVDLNTAVFTFQSALGRA